MTRISFKNLLLLVCVLLCVIPLAGDDTARSIYLVRHAEKLSDEPDALLSAKGKKRAECLARELKPKGIEGIYTTEVERTQQTAAPLAKESKLTATVIPAKDIDGLVQALRSSKARAVLVVGHSNTIPTIIKKLGAGEVSIDADEYDQLFMVQLGRDGKASLTVKKYCDSR